MVKSQHRVAALIYDDLCTFEFGIVAELFGLPRPEFDFPWYDFMVVPGEHGALRAVGGIAVGTNSTGDVTLAQTVIVPGWRSPSEVPPLGMVNMVRDAYDRGARIVSICGGVFVLADDDASAKRQPLHFRAHRSRGGFVGGHFVAAAAQARRRDGRAFGDARQRQREDAFDGLFVDDGRQRQGLSFRRGAIRARCG